MNTDPLAGRNHYQSSGAIRVATFWPLTMLALAVAAGLAGFMFWLFQLGHYYVFIVPFVCGLIVAGMANVAVAQGHCRNSIVAALTGFLLGAVLYIGMYYIGMIYHLGPETAGSPRTLFHYIQIRQATDVVHDVSRPDDEDKARRKPGSAGLNWFRFAFEFIFVVSIVTASAYSRSRRTYCEQCKRWMTRETTPFAPTQQQALLDSLQTGSARALAELCSAPPHSSVPNVTLALEYCPSLKDGRTRDCPAYISLKHVTANAQGVTLNSLDQAKGKMLARAVQLNPDELPALAPRFPALEAFVGRAAVASLLPKTEPEVSEEKRGELVEITPLGSDHSGRVLTRRMIWIGNALCLIGLGGFIGGLGLIAWGAHLLERTGGSVAGIALCVIGGLAVIVALAGFLFDTSYGGHRMLRRAFAAELRRRTGLFVDPYDPEALFVEIVPKLNWGKMMLENASDVGLLRVDKARREIRFEGDKERWRVPAAGILGCAVERYVHGQGAGSNFYYAVLRAAQRGGLWEAPIAERKGTGAFGGNRQKRAARLTAAIQELCVTPGQRTPHVR